MFNHQSYSLKNSKGTAKISISLRYKLKKGNNFTVTAFAIQTSTIQINYQKEISKHGITTKQLGSQNGLNILI